MRWSSAWLVGLAIVMACSAGCSKKKPSGGTQVGTGVDKDGGSDASTPSKKDAGVKKHKDAGSDASTDAASDDGGGGGKLSVDSGSPAAIDAGPPPLPTSWTCTPAFWNDGHCDCGCGAFDIDCRGESCKDQACWKASCDVCFTATGAWKPCAADPDPNDWTVVGKCADSELMDSNCDCGCGYPDPQCHGNGCIEPGCWRPACNIRHDSRHGGIQTSSGPPIGWASAACPMAQFGAGDGCDCGCGAQDPDCIHGIGDCTTAQCSGGGECDFCHAADGHRLPACNYDVDPANGSGWKCDVTHYGTGDGCDCGCGVADPDCGTTGCSGRACTSTTGCDRCNSAGLANDDVGGCLPATGGWTCDVHHYGTKDGCDCGCGIHDPDCGPATDGCETPGCQDDGKCDYCHSGPSDQLSDYALCKPAAGGGWSCGTVTDPAWANPNECDCGCGKRDPQCRAQSRSDCTKSGCQTPVCQFCDRVGAAAGACSGPAWTGKNACAIKNYDLNGLCDCGCGAIDADCAKNTGCADASCAADGCDTCHDGSGRLMVCQYWTCPQSAYNDGTTCDCGCGEPDPDCSNLGCDVPGCNTASCDMWHDQYGRAVAHP